MPTVVPPMVVPPTVPTAAAESADHCERTTVPVVFQAPAGLAQFVELIGEFTGWAPLAMDRGVDGRHSVVVCLRPGTTWAYQFVLDGETIINDPAADDFEERAGGGHVSVVTV